MTERTIGVIGVSGFVGSRVAKALLDRGFRVRGTLRAPDGPHRAWLEERLGSPPELTLHPADLRDGDAIHRALEGCQGAMMCAGVEAQKPETVTLMVGAAEHTLAAAKAHGLEAVVFTSSTGSTNPPGDEPERKNELDHWSDPDQQEAADKWSPAAKTRMERRALALAEETGVRVAILNPSLIAGPALPAEAPGYLRFIAAILAGDRFGDGASDGSMSMIDVRDLAALHIAALEKGEGRYFGVVRSWHWQDILEGLARVVPSYTAPPWPDDRPRSRPTQFDFTRRDQLGVELRGLDAILAATVEELERRGMMPA